MPERFERISLLSSANSYEVWDAWDRERYARVILKLPLPEKRDKASTVERLLREGRLLESLSHPHIVPAHELIRDPSPMLVMESLGGASLSHMIEAEPPLSDVEIGFLGLQLTSALAYLHRSGHLHLDLKPSNVIADAGRARLIDLGLATPPGPIEAELGTWSYMAPEQVRGGLVDGTADVWGLGATLFDCAAGFPPFNDPDVDEDHDYPQLHRRARPVALAARAFRGRDGRSPTYRQKRDHDQSRGKDPASPLGDDLARLIDACLDPEPAERPSLVEIAAALEQVTGLEPAEHRLSHNLRSGQEVRT